MVVGGFVLVGMLYFYVFGLVSSILFGLEYFGMVEVDLTSLIFLWGCLIFGGLVSIS